MTRPDYVLVIWPFVLKIENSETFYDEDGMDNIIHPANVQQRILLEESPTCRLLQSIHNKDMNGVLKAVSEGARLLDGEQKLCLSTPLVRFLASHDVGKRTSLKYVYI